MPAKLTGYEKVINRCNKIGWNNYPKIKTNFDFESLYKMIKYSDSKIIIGITHSPKSWEDYHQLLLHYDKFKRGVYLDKFIFIYGQEKGKELFDNYCKRQAYTNSFEYKHKKYGYTIEQFNDYNKSRAVTLDNLVKKYGKKLGEEIYIRYCDRQSYTNTKEYLGEERYIEVNKKKAHTIENYITRYGNDEGISKLIDFYGKFTTNKSHSKISQDCFKTLENIFNIEEKNSIYYAVKNKEYCLVAENKIFLYDFVCTKLKLCIEYHGDHYHGNPKLYRPDDYLRARGVTNIKAKEKWKLDETKIKLLKDLKGYDTIIIWDLDWRYNKELVIERIQNHILELRKKLEINYES